MELWYPKLRLEEEEATVILAGTHPKGMKYTGKHGYPAFSTMQVSEVSADALDAVVIPGGFAPDYFRRSAAMKDIVSQLFQQGKVVAAICHGPWLLCSAKVDGRPVISGVRCTCFEAVRDDVENAGGIFEDAALVIDQKVVTSRTPNDLVPFLKGIIAEMQDVEPQPEAPE